MTAMVLTSFFSGSVLFSFLSSTMDSRAALRDNARWAGESLSENGMRAYATISGGSNMPSRKRAVMSRLRETSISASLISPSFTARINELYSLPQAKSVPAFTARAEAASSDFVNLWPFQISEMAPQSETTYPLKPHSLRRISIINLLLAQQGSVFVRLYAHMTDAACASTTVARNAGR